MTITDLRAQIDYWSQHIHFTKETMLFLGQRTHLIEKYHHGFVSIKNEKILGVYPDIITAYKHARIFTHDPIFVIDINTIDVKCSSIDRIRKDEIRKKHDAFLSQHTDLKKIAFKIIIDYVRPKCLFEYLWELFMINESREEYLQLIKTWNNLDPYHFRFMNI